MKVRTTDGDRLASPNQSSPRSSWSVIVDAGREVTGAVVRNAAGTIIGISKRGVRRPQVRRTVLAERGGQDLHLVSRAGDLPCMTAFAMDLLPAPRFCTDFDPGTQIDGPFLPYGGAVTVACAPRQAMADGRVPDHLPAPRVILEGDHTIRSRTIRLRGEDAWVAFLPDESVRGLRSGKHRVPLRSTSRGARGPFDDLAVDALEVDGADAGDVVNLHGSFPQALSHSPACDARPARSLMSGESPGVRVRAPRRSQNRT
jgi:hypothetical protein